jgi:bacteriocin-like protein
MNELSIDELDSVSGGGIKGALEGVCTRDEGTSGQGGQNDPAQMFQQILQQLTQHQG